MLHTTAATGPAPRLTVLTVSSRLGSAHVTCTGRPPMLHAAGHTGGHTGVAGQHRTPQHRRTPSFAPGTDIATAATMLTSTVTPRPAPCYHLL
jgi:hypothetical protein